MIDLADTMPGRFCWVDLATHDAARAVEFYARAFGWTARCERASGGSLVRLSLDGRDVASLYQLADGPRARGVPSHWTAYLRVDDADAAVRRILGCGGRLVVAPFDSTVEARIALVEDATGALLGLWQARGAVVEGGVI